MNNILPGGAEAGWSPSNSPHTRIHTHAYRTLVRDRRMVGPVALEGSSRERSARFLFGWTSGSGCEGDDGLRTFRMRTYVQLDIHECT
jgi:hypothetical protein